MQIVLHRFGEFQVQAHFARPFRRPFSVRRRLAKREADSHQIPSLFSHEVESCSDGALSTLSDREVMNSERRPLKEGKRLRSPRRRLSWMSERTVMVRELRSRSYPYSLGWS